jgi:hypothetical protein
MWRPERVVLVDSCGGMAGGAAAGVVAAGGLKLSLGRSRSGCRPASPCRLTQWGASRAPVVLAPLSVTGPGRGR